MTTFYPGPSKVYPQVSDYLQDAFRTGVLSWNHRSPECMAMTQQTIQIFKQKLYIPDDYQVFFVSSATEVWEIIAQSLVKEKSVHFYNGAFGKKWLEYTQKLISESVGVCFDVEETMQSVIQNQSLEDAELIAITHNETSNGTKVDFQRSDFPSHCLLAVDATSSLGGVVLDWVEGDIWFASVQKCLGLPAGLGVMICSPKAMKTAKKIGDKKHYNSLLFIEENFKKNQTHYTPNVLGIYLLGRTMKAVEPIDSIDKITKKRAKNWYKFFTKEVPEESNLQILVQNPAVRSDTVITVKGSENDVALLLQKIKNKGFTLGKGYGEWKTNSFRIANFPAITDFEIAQLMGALE
jgi:phosphoserine aminotransferase